MTNIAGIDPGINGGFAIITAAGAFVDAGDIPTIGEGKSKRILVREIREILSDWRVNDAAIEQVSAMPGQGVSSTFRFGEAFGALQAVMACSAIPLTYVTPAVWKRHHKITGKGADGAEMARRKVIDRFPHQHKAFSRKKDHNRADALLIALWRAETGFQNRAIFSEAAE
jgi:crossover junction endodeoxyribonuclease RuvC